MIDDPRLAGTIIAAVDRRVEQLLAQRERHVRYGVVASVDTGNRRASVYLGGDATATPGFSFGPLVPTVGEIVRVEIGPAGDFVIVGLSGPNLNVSAASKRLRYVPIDPHIQAVPDASTTTANITTATVAEMTALPTNAYAVWVELIARQSIVATGTGARLAIHDMDSANAGGEVYFGYVAGFLSAGMGLVKLGGVNNRQFRYSIAMTGGGTVTYYLRVVGYFTLENT